MQLGDGWRMKACNVCNASTARMHEGWLLFPEHHSYISAMTQQPARMHESLQYLQRLTRTHALSQEWQAKQNALASFDRGTVFQ